jgi:hypothetical protein
MRATVRDYWPFVTHVKMTKFFILAICLSAAFARSKSRKQSDVARLGARLLFYEDQIPGWRVFRTPCKAKQRHARLRLSANKVTVEAAPLKFYCDILRFEPYANIALPLRACCIRILYHTPHDVGDASAQQVCSRHKLSWIKPRAINFPTQLSWWWRLFCSSSKVFGILGFVLKFITLCVGVVFW